MRYALLIYARDGAWEAFSDEERSAMYAEYGRLNRELAEAGKRVAGEELQPIATATTVRVQKGDTLVSDGPFAETKETLGGLYVIEAESLDEAVEWASRIPAARHGTVEVRPVVDHSGDVA